jgi:hypothetical protein
VLHFDYLSLSLVRPLSAAQQPQFTLTADSFYRPFQPGRSILKNN